MRTNSGNKLYYGTNREKHSLGEPPPRYGTRLASGPVGVADAYAAYQEEATADTLNGLFRAISRYASRLASMHLDPEDREDAAQEATLYVYRHLGKYDPNRGKFQQWVLAKILASFGSYRRAKYALKRGAGWKMVSLIADEVDAYFGPDLS